MNETGAREHPALLEIMTRRWYRAARADGLLERRHQRRHRLRHDVSYEDDGRRHHLAAAFVGHAGPRRRRGRDRPPRGAVPAGRVGLRRPLRRRDRRRGARQRRSSAALERADVPPLVQRIVLDVPAPIRGVSGGRRDHAAPLARRRLGARPRAAVRAPRAGRAAEPVAHVGVRARADRLARRRLPVPRRRPLQPEGRAAVRARRGARAERSCATRTGRVVSLPELEHMLAEALESLRRFQARRSPRERLLWNRVRLNVWPDDRPRAGRGGRADRPLRPRDRGPRHRDRDHPRPHARPARRRSCATASCACSRPPAAA